MVHGLSCSAACGILPDQGSNPCPLHWQVDSFFLIIICLFIHSWLCWVFVSVRGLSPVVASGATLHRGARASHCRGLSCCGAQAPDAQAQ